VTFTNAVIGMLDEGEIDEHKWITESESQESESLRE